MAARKRHCYDHPRPAVTVDLAAFAVRDGSLVVAMIRRDAEPFKGLWALPGGFLEIDEPILDGVVREFAEETGLTPTGTIGHIGVFGDPGRDPRGRTISLAHATVFRGAPPPIRGGDDAAEAAWVDAFDVEDLAFDHEAILQSALEWLTLGVDLGPLAFELLPAGFVFEDVAAMFRAIGGPEGHAEAWQVRMAEQGMIRPVGPTKEPTRRKPPRP